MNIAGNPFLFSPYPVTMITPAILWDRDAAGYWRGSDRGAAQDVYEAKVDFYRPEGQIDGLQTVLQANREGLVLSGFSTTGQEIFGPGVNYSGSINATVVGHEAQRHPRTGAVSSLSLTFRAISPTLLGTTPSLASLRLADGWEGDQEWTVGKAFSYGQTAYYSDPGAEAGTLNGTFSARLAEAKAILAYLLVTARANVVALPAFAGVNYPFGAARGSGPFNCVIPKWEMSRNGLNRWVFKITFAEAP